MSKSLFTTIIEEIAPTTETVGVVGQLYLNTVEKKLYQCVAINTETVDEVEVTTYTWQYISKDPNILINNGTGTGTTNCDYAILIGSKARANHGGVANNNPIVIGNEASVYNQTNGMAIGYKASAGEGSMVIGPNSTGSNNSVVFGDNADANNGVSIGNNTKTSSGVSIGHNAKNDYDPDTGYKASKTIQIGAGTNIHSNTVQIFNDTIYNHETHTATFQNIELNGTDINTVITNAVPTNVSQLTNDSGYLTSFTETDPTVPSHVKAITANDITNWNNKVDDSDLTNYYTKSNTYTKTEVDTKIANLIDSAPETLNTLNELAVAIQNNDSLIDTLDSAIGTKANDNAVVHLTGDESITGNKTFGSANNIHTVTIVDNNQDRPIIFGNNDTTSQSLRIDNTLKYNAGNKTLLTTNIKITGNISDGTNNIKVSEIANKSSLKTVATTGSYNDLTNKPDLTVYINKNVSDLTNYYTKTNIDTKLNDYSLKTHTHSYNELSDKPDISSLQSTVTAVQNRIKITRIQ